MPLPSASTHPGDIPAWKEAAVAGPEALAGLFMDRLVLGMSESQRNAVFAWLPTKDALACSFKASIDAQSPLSGVPYALKDLFDLAGVPTKAGSSFLHLARPAPPRNGRMADMLSKLGAVCAAKTNLHEFAYGLTGENPFYGDCDNPRHPGRTTGGSSSGSAAAVAAGLVPFAVGTDTGGSVRIPAAFCGLYGYRMEPGHPWVSDAFPLAPGYDTAGWFTRTASDLSFINTLLLGDKGPEKELRGLSLTFGRLDKCVADAFAEQSPRLAPPADSASGRQLLEAFKEASLTYTVLTSLEAVEVHKAWLDPFKESYSKTVWERIDRGRRWTEEQILRAASCRQFLRDTLVSYFLTYDFLVLPASPCPALPHAECADFDRTRILDLTAPASLAGLPVLSLPLQLAGGLSGGLQVLLPRSGKGTAAALIDKFRATAAE